MKRFYKLSILTAVLFVVVCLSLVSDRTAYAEISEMNNFTCANVTGMPPAECEVLVTLYQDTKGQQWVNNAGWLQNNTPCTWYGIQCHENRVRTIRLKENNLNGSIPPELGQLSQLASLSFHRNKLSGPIPAQLGELSQLYWLSLRYNQLSGSIPSALGKLSNLTTLQLSGNELTGSIPAQFGDLSELSHLALESNKLTGSIPTALANLQKLRVMHLNSNQLSGKIPPELGRLSELISLRLSGNLSGPIPQELGSLNNLIDLSISGYQLSGSIPSELGRLSNLTRLSIYSKSLTGTIPPALGNLSNLVYLSIAGSQINGSIPSTLSKLSNLTDLRLTGNQLSGSIPPALGKLVKLEYLYLYGNQLENSIPPALGDLNNLKGLNLDNNKLSGSIPPDLGKLSNLAGLDLQQNQLTGSIPTTFAQLHNLDYLNVFLNQLEGSIPEGLGQLTNLRRLFLHANRFTGPLPDTFDKLTALNQFYFYSTQLCEPDSLTDWFTTIQDKKGTGPCQTEQHPDLQITKTAPSQIIETGVYNLNITNIGGVPPADTTWVMDTLPTGVVPVKVVVAPTASADQWGCTIDGQEVACEYTGTFQPNQSEMLFIHVEITEDAAERVENCARVHIEDDADYENNESCVETEVIPKEPPFIYVSSTTSGKAGSINFRDEDILVFDSQAERWSMYFDGSRVGLSRADVNAFHILEDGNILMSLNRSMKIDGVAYDDSDIILFTVNNIGSKTAGTFSLYFDGSAALLNSNHEDIDAIALNAAGDLIISTLGTAKVGFTAKDEDLLRFEVKALGENTAGNWHLHLDGSDIGLTASGEDVSAVWLDNSKKINTLHLSALKYYTVESSGTALSGDQDDIFICESATLGTNTNCRLSSFWDGDEYGYGGERIDGYAIGPDPSSLFLRAASHNGVDGDPGVNDEDNEPDLTEHEEDDILDEEDVKVRIYLPVVNQ